MYIIRMDLHPTTRAFLEQIIDNEIRQIQFVVSAIRNDERFRTTTLKNEENYVLGFGMGKIMSSSSSMIITMHNRMGTLDEINQIQVIHTVVKKSQAHILIVERIRK